MATPGEARGGSPPLRSDGGKLRLDVVDTRETGPNAPGFPTTDQVAALTRAAELTRPPDRFSVIRAALTSAGADAAGDLRDRLRTVDGVLGTTVTDGGSDAAPVVNVLLGESKDLESSIRDLEQLDAVAGIGATEFRIGTGDGSESAPTAEAGSADDASAPEPASDGTTDDNRRPEGGPDANPETGADANPGTAPDAGPGTALDPGDGRGTDTVTTEPAGESILERAVSELDRRRREAGEPGIDEDRLVSDLATLLAHADELASLVDGEAAPHDRLASAEEAARTAAERADDLDATVADVRARTEALEGTVDDLRGELDELAEGVESARSTAATQEELVSKLVTRVDSKLEDMRSDIETMRSDIDEFERTDLGALRSEIRELREWQASLKAAVSLDSVDAEDDDVGDFEFPGAGE